MRTHCVATTRGAEMREIRSAVAWRDRDRKRACCDAVDVTRGIPLVIDGRALLERQQQTLIENGTTKILRLAGKPAAPQESLLSHQPH